MDQIYISKQRTPGFEIGESVLIKPIRLNKEGIKLFYNNIKSIEPVKIIIIKEIFKYLSYADNVIITGSFLEKGFNFKDIDVILVDNKNASLDKIKNDLIRILGLEIHIIHVNYKDLFRGLIMDPLFNLMLSKFISMKRVIFKRKKQINYKLLDLYLLESKLLIDNYDLLSGNNKYKSIRNLFAISLFLDDKELSLTFVNSEIDEYFGEGSVVRIKENMLDKDIFSKKYQLFYNKVFKKIIKGIENEQK